ncbi:FMN-binding protein [Paraclostridium bifermentans]|uniref:FMN-binding protein n=1 Tax=Paraclostridium bifermentans TaxID=1490 RepID=UPI001F2F1901|nr:FMN-binding protein [Paraclostridium bifermentans]MCE9676798.1 FMN-binding protein [Paraclostridium bifermentans]
MDIIHKILNEGFAWLSVAFGLILTCKFVVRIGMKKSRIYRDELKKLNKYMANTHKLMGISLVITGLIHGIFSGESVISLNTGTICWVISITLGVSWMARKILRKKGNWIKYHRVLTLIFLLTLGFHLIDVKIFDNKISTNILQHKKQMDYETQENKETSTSGYENTLLTDINGSLDKYKFKDGTYTGVADGYGPGLTVEIKVNENKVSDIKIVKHNEEGRKHYQRPMEMIPNEIIQNQSLEVDAVSGATYTSNGIVNAVKYALKQAIIK